MAGRPSTPLAISSGDNIILDVWTLNDGVTFVGLINDTQQDAIEPTTDLPTIQAALLAAAALWTPS